MPRNYPEHGRVRERIVEPDGTSVESEAVLLGAWEEARRQGAAMPAIIDSAPSCVTHVKGALRADDSADFIIQAAYEKCAGIMTFGPGTTHGDGGSGAATS